MQISKVDFEQVWQSLTLDGALSSWPEPSALRRHCCQPSKTLYALCKIDPRLEPRRECIDRKYEYVLLFTLAPL